MEWGEMKSRPPPPFSLSLRQIIEFHMALANDIEIKYTIYQAAGPLLQLWLNLINIKWKLIY